MHSLSKYAARCWFVPGLLLLSGCDTLFKPPEVEQPPAKVANAKAPKGPVFDPADGVKHFDDPIAKLDAPGDPKKPDAFKVVDVISGDLIKVVSVKTIKLGKPPKDVKTLGAPDIMRLAGIVVPAPNTPGWLDTVSKVREWVLNQEVDIERDPVYPIDLQGRSLVQVFFKPAAGKLKGQTLNLNRMLVRLGLAVVDINSPTSIDVKPWLNDEQFARSHVEPATTKGGKEKLVSLGLWAKGIVLQERQPAPTPVGSKVPTTRQNIAPETIKTTQKTTTHHTTSRITVPPVPSGGAGAYPGTSSSGTSTSGTATSGSATSGTATSGTSTSGGGYPSGVRTSG